MSSSLADKLLDDLASSEDEKEDDEENEIQPCSPHEQQHCDAMVEDHIAPSLSSSLRDLERRISSESCATQQEKYDLVLLCASTISEIEETTEQLHTKVISIYRWTFPELETLIPNALDYARIVRLSCEQKTIKLSTSLLSKILPSASVITLSVTASTSNKVYALSGIEEKECLDICESMNSLDNTRVKFLNYIHECVRVIAPNLIEIVGSLITAKLIAAAGGLKQLSGMPSGNLKILGKSEINDVRLRDISKKQLHGIHDGYIHTCPLVMSLPPSLRRKAGDVISGKASLAARVDTHSSSDGEVGKKLRDELEKKLESWQQRNPAKNIKPLSIPGDESKRKHRGGKRARKERERYGLTEAWKLKNRVKFGVDEEDGFGDRNDLENEGLGMMGGKVKVKIDLSKGDGIKLAGKKKLEAIKKKEGISDGERLGITSQLLLNKHGNDNDGIGSSKDSNNTRKVIRKSRKEKEKNYFAASTPFL